MKLKTTAIIALCAMLALGLAGCAGQGAAQLKDGYYSAEAAQFEHGWREFVTIYVSDGDIITCEYNAKNASGFIKSWDMDYMRLMNGVTGTYPNQYTRTYAADLVAKQSAGEIDGLTGATSSHQSFMQLASAAIEKARAGDDTVAVVDIAR